MKKLFLLGVAGLAITVAHPAFAADLDVYPVKAPFAARFTWTGCYLGAHLGGAWTNKDATDPVALVQNGLGAVTVGTTTATVTSTGAVFGGQIGCDYQFAPSWVAGLEGAVSAGTMKGSTRVGLPAGNAGDSELITTKTELIPAATARLGYAFDRWLVYAKGGVAWTSDKYSITGSFTGIPFDAEGLDYKTGWTAGAGIEWAFADDWSARLEYDYYDFGRTSVQMSDAGNGYSAPVSFRQTMQTVKLGVNFHVWGWQ